MNRILKEPSIWFNELWYQIKFILHKIYFYVFLNDIEIVIPPIKETINVIISMIDNNKSGVYIRFGDGEANIIGSRKVASRHQRYNKKLRNELIESAKLGGENILKSLMLHSNKYGYENGMRYGSFLITDKYADKILIKMYKYFIGNVIFSPIAIHYSSIFDRESFLRLIGSLKNNYSIFIGNDKVKNNIITHLNVNEYIITPNNNAYDKIDEIESQIDSFYKRKNGDYIIIIFSSGVSSKVLIKRLYNKYKGDKLFLFDFGSVIEMFNYEDSRWSWMKIKDKSYRDKLILDIKNI